MYLFKLMKYSAETLAGIVLKFGCRVSFACTHICMYVRLYMYVMYINIYTHTYILNIHTCTVYNQLCICVYTNMHVCIQTCTYIYTYIHAHIRYIYVYVCAVLSISFARSLWCDGNIQSTQCRWVCYICNIHVQYSLYLEKISWEDSVQ